MVSSMKAWMPYELQYHGQTNQGPGAAQNRGIRAATAPLVLLMADDIQPTERMLESHVRWHESHSDAHFASLGRVLQSPDLPQTTFQRNWDPFKYYELDDLGQDVELPYWKFWACNIAVKRDFLLQHGLFQEWKGAAHEDVELGWRLSRAGLKIVYNPGALAHHYHVETLEQAARRAYERGLNWRYIERHIPDPQIAVKYHVLTRRTLKQHVQTFRRLSETSLPPEDRNLAWLLFRQMVRWAVFNRWTVPGFWMKLLHAAETNRLAAAVVNPYFYRGAVFYYFVKGCGDGSQMGQITQMTPNESQAH